MARVPLRRHLLLLAVASVLPIALLAGVGLFFLFEQQRADVERKALEIARALATAVDAELKRSISALQVLGSTNSLGRGDMEAFDKTARRVVAGQRQWRSINVATPEGEELVNTRVPRGEPLPKIMARDSFDAAVREGVPHVGNLTDGRGHPAIPLRVPIFRDGRLLYVLTAIVDPEAVHGIITRQRVSEGWVVSVFDASGLRVARSREHAQYLGTRPTESLRELLRRPGGEGSGASTTLEGQSVFTAYVRLPESRWTVVMGIPVTVAYEGVARTLAAYAAAVTLSILIGLLAAFALARRINGPMAQLREAAHSLGRGEVGTLPQTEIREIHEVGEAIADAARRRSAIEAEREDLLHREQAARSEAEAASRAKDSFLAMLGHELRNPLAALSNAATLLGFAPDQGGPAARARDVIQRQVAHLARLTDDLLDAARALLGKIDLRPEPLDLAKIAGQALATLAATGRTVRHPVRAELDEAWVEGDPVRLDQVVCNLLVNAVKYTPEGGNIVVRVRRDGGDAVLTVADDGAGMSPELAARAFDLFVQGERALDRTQGGLGIGLTLVRRLAELHGGRADVHSEGEDRGSEFTVRLPAIEKPADAAPAEPELLPDQRRTVLVVEDNDDARETLTLLLEMMGHRVEAARDGLAGVEKALAMAPDIALVDLGLPGLDGYQVARRVRSSGASSIYLVALTGYGAPEDRKRALEAGFDAHMTKPVRADELAELLRRLGSASPSA